MSGENIRSKHGNGYLKKSVSSNNLIWSSVQPADTFKIEFRSMGDDIYTIQKSGSPDNEGYFTVDNDDENTVYLGDLSDGNPRTDQLFKITDPDEDGWFDYVPMGTDQKLFVLLEDDGRGNVTRNNIIAKRNDEIEKGEVDKTKFTKPLTLGTESAQ